MRNRTLHLHMQAGKVFPNYLKPIAVALVLLCSLLCNAQAPQQFSFQGVARDAAGKIVANSNVKLRLTIHKSTATGQSVFQEEHDAQTNSAGVFNINVGSVVGGLTGVDWKSDIYFLQVELDPDGGNNLIDLGATQVMSVPYALHAEEASRLKNDDPIVLKGEIGNGALLPTQQSGPRLIWYPRKGAFRAGDHFAGYWVDGNIGEYSTALGSAVKASGKYSIAIGYNSVATAQESIAMGSVNLASGAGSVAIGGSNNASAISSKIFGENSATEGNGSIAIGNGLLAKARNSIVLGEFNWTGDSPNPNVAVATDRIFQIGNGTGKNNRANVLTIMRNGNIGLGNNVVDPQFSVDMAGRARIRYNGSTAGVYFDNSQNATDGFVGMKVDTEIGFYLKGWRFWVTDQGNGYLNGNLIQTSDRRLKTNIQPFKSSLRKVNSLQGYHYNWEDKTKDQTLQTGLIAQEVEQVFPELVSTNKDGYKSVNYIGLVPHLIESVKELKSKTDEIAVLCKELEGMREMGKRLELLEASINSGANSRTTKSAAK
ncbi:tail fiber domain-containing protein [Dyadobacter chenhuakuii]|uniref:Tail fiber domain-containing protein n=1 Tax=Dyadobacter chenhuakuii TaxID=2909339 RepID=A0A9X1TSF0_9BACT|nr:tail fiber domain-containing protein [Dyadobacter chenhuakuii]MCF2496852.1 tail fiber domain-containing protein [Dyadobacter chenhuakuii]